MADMAVRRSKRRGRLAWWATLAALLLGPTAASAHEIHIVAHPHGAEIHGEVHDDADLPEAGAEVVARDPSGNVLASTTTDEKGAFTLEAKVRCDHRITVNTDDGHSGSYTVAASLLPSSLPSLDADHDADHDTDHDADHPPAAGGTLLEKVRIVEAKVDHLQAELERLESKKEFRDLLGGVGYILGLAGTAFYFLGRRRPAGDGG